VAAINEGPDVIKRGTKIFIVYNANASWTDSYNVGMLTNTNGNVMNAASWTKQSTPVFSKTANVFGPGIGAFVKSPDGLEDWMVYHAAKSSGSGWDRNIRTQKFTFNASNVPVFGTPVQTGISAVVPSGEGTTCTTCNTYHNWGSAGSVPVKGTWLIGSDTSVTSDSLGSVWNQIFRSGTGTANYTVTANARWTANGSSAFPKYGIYAAYKDSQNYVAVFLDKQYSVMATHAMINGVDQGWQNTPLTIDFTQFHTLKVTKTNTTFDFSVDSALLQSRTFTITPTHIGPVTEDTKADYQSISVNP
jgi:hypothetical protein